MADLVLLNSLIGSIMPIMKISELKFNQSHFGQAQMKGSVDTLGSMMVQFLQNIFQQPLKWVTMTLRKLKMSLRKVKMRHWTHQMVLLILAQFIITFIIVLVIMIGIMVIYSHFLLDLGRWMMTEHSDEGFCKFYLMM